jgi:hypothetical protein
MHFKPTRESEISPKADEACDWTIKTVNIEGGTHSADSANSYRAGMLWLFGRIPVVP